MLLELLRVTSSIITINMYHCYHCKNYEGNVTVLHYTVVSITLWENSNKTYEHFENLTSIGCNSGFASLNI